MLVPSMADVLRLAVIHERSRENASSLAEFLGGCLKPSRRRRLKGVSDTVALGPSTRSHSVGWGGAGGAVTAVAVGGTVSLLLVVVSLRGRPGRRAAVGGALGGCGVVG